MDSSSSPWERLRQDTFIWGCFATVLAIVLTVVGTVIHDIRWFLWVAWPFASAAVWAFARTWTRSRVIVSLITIPGIFLPGLAVLFLYNSLAPPVIETRLDADLAIPGMDYAPHTMIHGIEWQESYFEGRITLINRANQQYSNLDMLVKSNLSIAQIGFISQFSKCTAGAWPVNPEFLLPGTDAEGNKMTIVPHPIAVFAPIYRIQCDKISGFDQIGIMIAVVNINPTVNGKPPAAPLGPRTRPNWMILSIAFDALGQRYYGVFTKCFIGACPQMPN